MTGPAPSTREQTAASGAVPPGTHMRIGVPCESSARETRVAATPSTVAQLVDLGYEVVVETGAGTGSGFPDQDYAAAAARIAPAEDAWRSDVVLEVKAPSLKEIGLLRDGATLVSLLAPALDRSWSRRWRSGRSREAAASPIAGMPVLRVWEAERVVVFKRSMNTG